MLTPMLELHLRLRTTSQAALARELGLDPTALSHVLGGRRALPDRCLPMLGLERVVRYRRLRAATNGAAA
jgi:DNA-binding transcriptional regulator YdaS (Cro superfamily)